MSSKAPRGPGGLGPHTAGIYADMTVDGPEIGTLVMIIDRAKNLPNRRTMGKQNPYCAARLGKEAKKTDTDMRGGQTPKWDQELRFTVHDSPDYNNLKVSVFNDDKKTDLIGETMISLEEVILPGGGQGDKWHSLNCKGRYAGEIRIELTYYDSRPKTERTKDKGRKYSATDLANLDQLAAMANTKLHSTVRRRPLPSDHIVSAPSLPQGPSIVPIPRAELRSYHTPPSQDSSSQIPSGQQYNLTEIGHHNSQQSSSFSNMQHPAGFARSLPSSLDQDQAPVEERDMHSHNSTNDAHYGSDHFYDEPQEHCAFDDYDIPVTDDPYALEAVNSQTYLRDHDFGPQSILPRNHRVLELSGSPLSRPSPNITLLHAHSAPLLGSNELCQVMDNEFYHRNHEWSRADIHGSPGFANNGVSSPLNPSNYAMKHHENGYAEENDKNSSPPPPPVHRSSAPASARPANHRPSYAQSSSPMGQPAYHATGIADVPEGSTHSLDHRDDREFRQQIDGAISHSRQFQRYSPNPAQQLHHRHQSADGLDSQYHDPQFHARPNYFDEPRGAHPSDVVDFQPRRSLGLSPERPFYQNQMDNHMKSSVPGPTRHESPRMHDNRNEPQIRTTPLIKPRAISPNRGLRSSPRQPTNATSKHSTPPIAHATTSSTMPYSPDSFTVFNPQHSNPSTPNVGTTPGTQRELSAMYNNSKKTPTQPQPQSPSQAPPEDEPIIGSDGKVKDPTDHLPPSSYAPEPERKGNRPSIVVNQRNRFGPREARPVPVTTRQQHSAPSTPTALRTSSFVPNTQQSPRQAQQHSRMGSPLPLQDGSLSPQQSPWNGNNHTAQTNYVGHGFGYDRVEIFAPPIPAKLPLDSRGDSLQRMGTDDSLGTHIGRLSLDNLGDSNITTVYGGRGGATRPRRSRFGA